MATRPLSDNMLITIYHSAKPMSIGINKRLKVFENHRDGRGMAGRRARPGVQEISVTSTDRFQPANKEGKALLHGKGASGR
jgi:hypothetical protein